MPDDAIPRTLDRTLRDARGLEAAGLITPEALPAIEAVAERYSISVTPSVAALIETLDDPIGLQFIPDPAELVTAPHEIEDPTADAPFTPVKGIVHRYPDRALLKPLLACPVYCRFCFRREVVGPDGGLLTEAELDAAIAWLEATPAIREVVMTGGDPLMLADTRLEEGDVVVVYTDGITDQRPPHGRTEADVVELVRPTLEEKSLVLVASLGADPGVVLGNHPELEQLFLNLVLNAHEVTPSGGTVMLDVGRTETHVTVTVSDSGPGIPAELTERVFEPFFTTKARGSGLGLAISAGIAQAHGARLRADNRPAGGAIFTVEFPVASVVSAMVV